MYPLDPIGDRPTYQRQILNQKPLPIEGNKAIWILGIMAGALGILAVVSAI